MTDRAVGGSSFAGVARLALIAIVALILTPATGCQGSISGGNEENPPEPAVVLVVSGARAVQAPLTSEVHLLGTTAAQRHLTLRAPAAGRILGFELKTGDTVHRGQVVARVINREVEAAQSGLAVAQAIDPDESSRLAAAVKRNLAPAAIAVTAPADAVVVQPQVSTGQIVAELDPLADLIEPRSIYVEAAVPLDQLGRIRPGMEARVSSPLAAGAQYPARIAALSPSFAAGSATAIVRVEFVGAERIRLVGAPVELAVTTESVTAAIVVPNAAIFDDASTHTHYVFVAGPDGIAHRRIVTTGVRAAGRVEILAGVRLGEVVITSGGYALSDGLRVQIAQGSS